MNFRHPRRNSATCMIMTLYMWTLLSPKLYLLFTARYMYLNLKFNNTHVWKCSIIINNSWIFFIQNEKTMESNSYWSPWSEDFRIKIYLKYIKIYKLWILEK